MVESISRELRSGRRETNPTQDIRSNRRPDGGPKCWSCGRSGHVAAMCFQNRAQRQNQNPKNKQDYFGRSQYQTQPKEFNQNLPTISTQQNTERPNNLYRNQNQNQESMGNVNTYRYNHSNQYQNTYNRNNGNYQRQSQQPGGNYQRQRQQSAGNYQRQSQQPGGNHQRLANQSGFYQPQNERNDNNSNIPPNNQKENYRALPIADQNYYQLRYENESNACGENWSQDQVQFNATVDETCGKIGMYSVTVEGLLHITILVNGKNITALLDTGSPTTIINVNLLKEIEATMRHYSGPKLVCGNNGDLNIIGETDVKISVPNVNNEIIDLPITAVVVYGAPFSFLLGNDFSTRAKVNISFTDKMVRFQVDSKMIQKLPGLNFVTYERNEATKIHSAENITLPARSLSTIKVAVNKKSKNMSVCGLICTTLPVYQKIGVSVANSLIKFQNGEALVPIMNAQTELKEIDAGTI